MSQRTRFIRHLTTEDLVDVELDLHQGRVVGFRVNYRAYLHNTWVEIARYDTRHGRLHLHRFWLDSDEQVLDLEPQNRSTRDYGARFTQAVEDISENWTAYRACCEARTS